MMIDQIPENLLKLIKDGESSTVEFKTAKKNLPDSLFETVCSMLNRNGGHIFLGVQDDGKIIGVYKDYVKNIKKDFANLCNNSEKISPTVHLEIKEYMYDEKEILYIYVYESSDVHKTANRIFDRNEDGDFEITGNTSLISQLYIRKSSTYIENKIYPFATIDDLRKDLIDKARNMAVNRVANHPWAKMNDLDMLRSASLYEKNLQTGEEGINLAGLLLFGKDDVIASALSYYKTDAILKVDNVDRYDDRDDIRTNLIESYERLINFVKKHLNEKFYMDGNQRINIRDVIARELCVNLLIHREYANPIPARLIITKESIMTENANRPRNIGYIDLNNYSPYPKNPKIANFFKEIGLAEELGSGIKTITKYNKIYSGGVPSFKDDEIFTVTVPLAEKVTDIVLDAIEEMDELKIKLFEYIKNSNGVSRQEINDYMYPLFDTTDENELNNKTRYIINFLRERNLIHNKGTKNKPKWILKK